MQRFLVAILAAVDAVVAAAIVVAALAAPLTILWAVAFGVTGNWDALWPTVAAIWRLGHGAPLAIDIAEDAVRALGIAPDAAQFTVSLPPLGIMLFTLIFAARSGRRAVRAGSWVVGVGTGTVVFAALATTIALTSQTDVVRTPLVWAIVAPTAVYAAGSVAGAVTLAWRVDDHGFVSRVRDWLDDRGMWGALPTHVVRGAAAATVGIIGVAAVTVALATILHAGEIVALFEALRADGLGVTMIGLAQVLAVPTVIGWAVAWLAGPGFVVGVGATVSPAATEPAIVPGIPLFGLLPDGGSPWLLIVILLPVGVGACAGWIVRSRMVWQHDDAPLLHRAIVSIGIGLTAAGIGALIAWVSSGALGPGRLQVVGASPGFVALALGAEIFIGAAILLLSPRHPEDTAGWLREDETAPVMSDQSPH
ncbi:cell division protein PerM [Microbacterium sp. YY-01]|uniref:cell division protein PerM n=1 Tax=Microbacterium sp. YY-01 TaxID=3421634 RepID=UPI003D1842D8